MKHLLTILAFLIIVCAPANACAYYEDRVTDVGAQIAHGDERIVHGDTRCRPEHREAAERAYASWAVFTRGHKRRRVVWDLTEMNFMDLSPPVLKCLAPTAETGNMGGRTEGEVIYWLPDTCTDLQACIMHEIGHSFGLEHFKDVRGQVMSMHNAAHVFGVLDRRECLSKGVCVERAPDVTTVTVTVDPAIPRVEPIPPGW